MIPNVTINSFWSKSKKPKEEVEVVTKVLTEENRISALTHDLGVAILSAVGIFSITKKIDAVKLQPKMETNPEELAVTKEQNDDGDMGGMIAGIVVAASVLIAGFGENIFKMLKKMFVTVETTLSTVMNNVYDTLMSIVNIGVSDRGQTKAANVSQYEQTSNVDQGDKSKPYTVEDERKDDERKVKEAASNISGTAGQTNQKKSAPTLVSQQKESDIKRLDVTSVPMGAGEQIDYTEGDEYGSTVSVSKNEETTKISLSDKPASGPKRNPNSRSDLPNMPLPKVRPLTAQEVEGVNLKTDPSNPVTLHGIDPDIIGAFKRIEKDVGAKLIITGARDDHRRAVGPDTRHDHGTALDIGYSRNPILQSNAGRTLVLKAAIKEGITGIGFERDHMHIDIAAIKLKQPKLRNHWGTFDQEQQKILSDSYAGKMPDISPISPTPPGGSPPGGSKGNKSSSSSSWWQSVESYFGAVEPAQGNKHHAGT